MSAAMRRVPLALVVILLSGCGLEFGGGRGATRQGRDIFGLWQGSVIVALLVGGLVWGLIVFAVLRYRRRHDDLPSQTQYFVKLEILYTVVPVIIVAVLFAFSYRTQNEVDALASHPAVTIDVKGFQWQWQFHYRDDDVCDSQCCADWDVQPIGRVRDGGKLVHAHDDESVRPVRRRRRSWFHLRV